MEKVAILTNFTEHAPGYSLTGIVSDQALMLARGDYEPHIFVGETFQGDFPLSRQYPNIFIDKKIPIGDLIDYQTLEAVTPGHKRFATRIADVLVEELEGFKYAFSHDFVFTGWNVPYGLGIQEASPRLPNVRWLHWIHSVPTAFSDWWNIRAYGPKHKIVYPNKTDSLRAAEQYRGRIEDVRVIPHIKDLRTWFDFDGETWEIIDEYPQIMSADVVQVYPASVDRMVAKRVDVVIKLFGFIKSFGVTVCLVLANQHATGRQQAEDIQKYKDLAESRGLVVGKDVVFTADWKGGKYGVGLPKRNLRELMQCMNLFVFPTREESFGLVLPEAALSSGCLCVLNKSLIMQLEIAGFSTIFFDFGSFHNNFEPDDWDQYLTGIAKIILGRIAQNEGILTRTHMRTRNNMDFLLKRVYEPIMKEADAW